MNRSGLIRKLDKVGRVSLPTSIRNALNIREGSMVEFGVEGSTVTLTRYSPVCFICGDDHDVSKYQIKTRPGATEMAEVRICQSCKLQLTNAKPVSEPMDSGDWLEGELGK